jgi:QueT transporter
MGSTPLQQADRTRTIVYAGLVASVYAISTIALSPIAFGPIQFRVGGLLMPLALVNPVYGVGLAVGVALANLTSPFGPYDYFVMPLVTLLVTQAAYRLRSTPFVTLPLMAAVMAGAIAYFPLYLGGGIPWWPTILFVFISLLILYVGGYLLWRATPLWDGVD